MGYKPKRTLYQLAFEDPDFDGLEVTTRSLSIDALVKMLDLADQVEENPSALKAVDELLGRFAGAIVSWNVEDDDDKPVPPTKEGLGSLDIDFVMRVITAWTTAMVQAPPPLPGASPSGGTSPEAPTGLAAQSSVLPSS